MRKQARIAGQLMHLANSIKNWRDDDRAGYSDIIAILDGVEELLTEAATLITYQLAAGAERKDGAA